MEPMGRALNCSTRNGHIATVRVLLDAGASRDLEDEDGLTAATYFGRFCFGHMDLVFKLH